MRPYALIPILVVLLAAPAAFAQTSAGSRPADFKLTQLAGPPVALENYMGDVILLSFWATWCGPCKAEIPHLVALQSKYQEKGFTVLGINTDEARNQAKVRSEVKTRGVNYPVLLDSETEVLSQMNPSMNLPFAVVIDKTGTVHSVHSGYSPGDEKKLEAEIRALLGLTDEAPAPEAPAPEAPAPEAPAPEAPAPEAPAANPCAPAANPCAK